MTNAYDFSSKTLEGDEFKLSQHQGKVLLIVNTASKCGFTPQYEGLEKLHQHYQAQGLEIIGFPCNQFGKQEPGSTDEIGSFCQRNYGVSFTMSEKIDVNGANTHPLYQYLKHEQKGLLGTEGIKWNFTKFLVGRDGNVLARYAPTVKPAALASDIEQALSAV